MKEISEDEENKEVVAKHLISLTREQYNHLQECSAMLGRIGSHVEDFIKDEEDTTEIAVLRVVSQYYFMRSDETHDLLLRLQKEQRC